MTGLEDLHRRNRTTARILAAWFGALRPHLLVPAWACALTGAAAGAVNGAGVAVSLSPWQRACAVAGWSAALAAGHVMNLIHDRWSDTLNRKNLFWQPWLTLSQMHRLTVILSTVALCAALLLLGTALLSKAALIVPAGLIVGTLVLALAYSAPPVRLSARWGWDLTANALGYGLVAPWFGAVLVDPRGAGSHPPWAQVLVLVPLVAAAFLWTTVMDCRGDEQAGKRSWAVRWGIRPTLLLASLSVGIALPAAGLLPDSTGLHPQLAAGLPQAGTTRATRVVLVAAVGLVLVASCHLVLTRPRLRHLRRATQLAVAAAATGGLLRWPLAAPIWFGWLVLSQACLLAAGQAISARQPSTVPRRAQLVPSSAPSAHAGSCPPDRSP